MTQTILIAGPPPRCSICRQPPSKVAYHEIPDGATNILTDWRWVCPGGDEWPALLDDITVSALEPFDADVRFDVPPVGLWQINSAPWPRWQEAISDPLTNARAAYQMWSERRARADIGWTVPPTQRETPDGTDKH